MGEPLSGIPHVDTMSGADALLWTISADPVMRPTIVAILLLRGTPEWGEVQRRVAQLVEQVPRLRSVAVTRPPGRGRPQFIPDDGFDMGSHLRRMRVAGTGGLREVLDLAQSMATTGFDGALPLWEAVLVEDVGAEHSALIMKVHHALIDGVGGLAVLAHLFDAPPGTNAAGGGAHAGTLTRPALRRPVWRSGPLRAVPDIAGLAGGAARCVTHPVQSLHQGISVGVSAARLMAPAGRPKSPIMTERSFRRHLEIFEFDLATLKAAANGWSATVNDVFVSSVVHGVAVYHELHGASPTAFRVLMPVNVRGAGADEGGNHFVPARFVIPLHREPSSCVAEVRRQTAEWKHAPGLAISDVLATALSSLPAFVARSLWGSMLLGNDFCITNIPGPPVAVAFAGSPVEGIYAASPPSGAALNVSLISAGHRACVAVTTDVAAIADGAKLAACIEDAFAEICSAAPHVPRLDRSGGGRRRQLDRCRLGPRGLQGHVPGQPGPALP